VWRAKRRERAQERRCRAQPACRRGRTSRAKSSATRFSTRWCADEEDVAGLVAYSIYKQNKRAWLDDFVKTTGRAPSEAETRSYIIGESTERRLATYRRLAASTLSGDAPSRAAGRGKAPVTGIATGALWAVAIIVALAVVGLAIHSGYFAGAK
jgi:hypothetical protein